MVSSHRWFGTADRGASRTSRARLRTAALALLLAAGLAACGAATRDGDTARGHAAVPPVTQAVTPTAPTMTDDGATSVTGAPVYYIVVRSDEQALAERVRMAEVNRRIAANGGPELQVVVIVVGSDEEAAQIRRAVAQVNVLRDAEGLAAITVLDRRSP